MTTKVVPGMLVAVADQHGVAHETSTRISRAITDALDKRGTCALALSGGKTPSPAYALLANETLDWNKVEIFWVDERAVPPDHERSNYRAAKEALLDRAEIPEINVHRMPGDAPDLDQAARQYAQLLSSRVAAVTPTSAPQLDLLVMGVGDDGHTASLFPGEKTVDILDRWVAAVPSARDREARLTITVPVIEQARAVLIVCVGKTKQEPLERIWSVSGDVHHTPGRVFRGCRGAVTWIIDKAAGGLG
jgi:6-phosphogluconolactonase